MLKFLPTLAFDTGIEIENWTHLNKFRAAVSVLKTSFDFFLVLFPQEKWSSHVQSTELLIKRMWSGLLFSWWKHSDKTYFIKRRRWLMIRQTQSTRAIDGGFFQKEITSMYESSCTLFYLTFFTGKLTDYTNWWTVIFQCV